MLSLLKRGRRAVIEARYRWGARLRRAPGTAARTRSIPVIVTLTSYGARLTTVHLAIESLLSQTVKPDRIVLWQSHPIEALPDTVTVLQRRGLEICRVDDLGPVTKVLYALRDYPQAIVVTVDDDIIYPRGWLGGLLDGHQRWPGAIVCYRAHQMTWEGPGRIAPYHSWQYESPGVQGPSLMLFPTGVTGVLYPPQSLHPDVLDIAVNQALSRTNDDIWLKAMSLRQETPCVKVASFSRDFYTIRGTQDGALWRTNTAQANDVQLYAVFDRYGLQESLWRMTSEGR